MLFSVKLFEYIFSADIVCSNPYVGPLPRIKISYFLLLIFIYEHISTPKITTFLPVPPLGCEENPCLSNPVLYSECLYLSMAAFLVKLTAPNKQFYSVG